MTCENIPSRAPEWILAFEAMDSSWSNIKSLLCHTDTQPSCAVRQICSGPTWPTTKTGVLMMLFVSEVPLDLLRKIKETTQSSRGFCLVDVATETYGRA